MTICQPFTNDQWDDGLIPKDIVSDAERDINVLMRLYYLRHGFADAHVYLTAPLSKIGFMSLQSINDQTTPQKLEDTRSNLLLSLRGLREQGQNYYIARTIYHVIKSRLRPEEARLSQHLANPETAADESPALDGEIQSGWVPHIVNISDEPVAEELSKLAKQFLMLDSSEQSEDEIGNDSPLST
jgi:hypothetical protein